LFLAALLAACSAPEENAATESAPAASRPDSRTGRSEDSGSGTQRVAGVAYDVFGAGVAADKQAVPVDRAVASIDDLNGKTICIEGVVDSVCKKKGCWVNVAGEREKVFVRFKDYGFFLPLDCEGRVAVLEGVINQKEMPVEEARHYAEDAGDLEKAAKIDKPQMVVQFLASGVRLRQRDGK